MTPCCWCCSGSSPVSQSWACSLSVMASSRSPSLWSSDPSTTWASATHSYCWDHSMYVTLHYPSTPGAHEAHCAKSCFTHLWRVHCGVICPWARHETSSCESLTFVSSVAPSCKVFSQSLTPWMAFKSSLQLHNNQLTFTGLDKMLKVKIKVAAVELTYSFICLLPMMLKAEMCTCIIHKNVWIIHPLKIWGSKLTNCLYLIGLKYEHPLPVFF